MKKILTIALALLIALSGTALAAEKIVIGASPTPHAEILAVVKDVLAEQGYELEIIEYNDYILPNVATQSGELDANYFQHVPYLNEWNEENGANLVAVAEMHYEPFGLYAGKLDSLDDIPDGATIAVPNDGTNEARALLLMQQIGLITLKEGVGLTATKIDVVDNPKNIDIVEMEAAQLPRVLPEVDFAIINGNYAILGGLKVSEALAVEAADSEAAQTYVNVIVVKEGNEASEKIQALIATLQTEEVRQFMIDNYDGAVLPMF